VDCLFHHPGANLNLQSYRVFNIAFKIIVGFGFGSDCIPLALSMAVMGYLGYTKRTNLKPSVAPPKLVNFDCAAGSAG